MSRARYPRRVESEVRPLTIAHVDAEREFSGGEVQVFLLMQGLADRGHRCVLVAPPGSRAGAEATRRGIEVREVAMRGDLDLPALGRLRRAFAECGADLVHLHTGRATWRGGLAARRAGLPALTTRRMDRAVKRGWRTRWIYGRLVRRAVAISPAVRACLVAGGVPEAMLRTIPSAVDDALVLPATDAAARRDEVRRELDCGPDEDVLLTLASLVPRKGIDVLLEAVDALDEPAPPFRLWIAGDGPERARLEERARASRHAARIAFLGRRDDAARLLGACDVFVLPSRREGLGVAALEALAAGRAVVATRVGGLGEVIEHERCGLLVEPEDVGGLAEALGRVLADVELRNRLAAAGPERVAAGHLASQMTAAYEALYREILAER